MSDPRIQALMERLAGDPARGVAVVAYFAAQSVAVVRELGLDRHFVRN